MSNPVSKESSTEINSNFDVPVVVGSGFDEPDCGDGTSNSDAKSPDVSPDVSIGEPLAAECPEIILERTSQHPPRITSLCRLAKGESLTLHKSTGSIEALVLSGSCNNKQAIYERGSYLRFPVGVELQSKEGCSLFVKQNQFLEGDDGQRHIAIYDDQNWMPGPTDEMLIKPLHVFGSESIMVLRWKQACEFRPNLNPNGEEILVLDGLLQNRDHLYRPMSWIRNPVPDWRDWHGSTDTYLYYKSGHFPR